MKTKVFLFSFGMTLSLLMTGCDNKISDEELLQEYLQERYGEEFVVLNTERTANGYTPFSYRCSASCISQS